MANEKSWTHLLLNMWIEGQEQIIIQDGLYRLCKWLILPHKPAFVRHMRRVDAATPACMRITSDLEDGMSDDACVSGVIGLVLIGVVFFALLLRTMFDPHVTINATFGFTFILLAMWCLFAVGARWQMEEDIARKHERTSRGIRGRMHLD